MPPPLPKTSLYGGEESERGMGNAAGVAAQGRASRVRSSWCIDEPQPVGLDCERVK